MNSKQQSAEQQAALAHLRETLKPGDTVYTILRHVSRSGMQREISLKVPGAEEIGDITYSAACALGNRVGKHNGVVVGGCGMDMGFHLVHNLSYVLFRDGFGCIGEGCPSNDHSNGDRDYTPYLTEEERTNDAGELCNCHNSTHWHKEGGYALRQRWL